MSGVDCVRFVLFCFIFYFNLLLCLLLLLPLFVLLPAKTIYENNENIQYVISELQQFHQQQQQKHFGGEIFLFLLFILILLPGHFCFHHVDGNNGVSSLLESFTFPVWVILALSPSLWHPSIGWTKHVLSRRVPLRKLADGYHRCQGMTSYRTQIPWSHSKGRCPWGAAWRFGPQRT